MKTLSEWSSGRQVQTMLHRLVKIFASLLGTNTMKAWLCPGGANGIISTPEDGRSS